MRNITLVDTDGCLKPCEGVYADITKVDDGKIDEQYYESLLQSYYSYKRFFDKDDSKSF